MLVEKIFQAAQSIWCLTLENKTERKSIFDYKMYISYLRCCYHSQILLSAAAWPLRAHVGFAGDMVRVTVFQRHQVGDQVCCGGNREVEPRKNRVQTVTSPKTGFPRVNRRQTDSLHHRWHAGPKGMTFCTRDNPEWTKSRRKNRFWHSCFCLFILYPVSISLRYFCLFDKLFKIHEPTWGSVRWTVAATVFN